MKDPQNQRKCLPHLLWQLQNWSSPLNHLQIWNRCGDSCGCSSRPGARVNYASRSRMLLRTLEDSCNFFQNYVIRGWRWTTKMNQPLKNAQPTAPATQTIGQWVTPTTFPRREDVNCHSTKGVWRQHSWPEIYDITELSIFRMALPEKWVRDVLIPATNEGISGDGITLKDFYVYLGCHFFMACFEGISDRRLWWYPKPVSIWEIFPFRLHKYIALRQFISIISAMSFTNKPSHSFLDRFHDVQHMIKYFNEHYLDN